MAKPFPDGKQADIPFSGITTIDDPAARNWHLTSRPPTSWRGYQPVKSSSAKLRSAIRRAQKCTTLIMMSSPAQYGWRPAGAPSTWPLSGDGDVLSAVRARFGGRARGLYQGGVFLFTKHMRDLGLPPDDLEGKFNKDISFALRRGTIAQLTTALDAAQRAAEDEQPALNETGWAR